MERGEELLVLLVQVAALPTERLHDGLPLGEGAGHGAVQTVVPYNIQHTSSEHQCCGSGSVFRSFVDPDPFS